MSIFTSLLQQFIFNFFPLDIVASPVLGQLSVQTVLHPVAAVWLNYRHNQTKCGAMGALTGAGTLSYPHVSSQAVHEPNISTTKVLAKQKCTKKITLKCTKTVDRACNTYSYSMQMQMLNMH